MLQRVDLQRHTALEGLPTGLTGEGHVLGVGNHVLAHVRHGVKLLLADLTGELLLRVAVHYLVVLMKRPQFLEGFATCHALDVALTVRLSVQLQLTLQQEALPTLATDLHPAVGHVHMLF